jgi:hypothetical protein
VAGTTNKWAKTKSWNTYFLQTYDEDGLIRSPFAERRFGPAPVVLYVSSLTPAPGFNFAGVWHAHPDVESAALNLRHFILPQLFGTWLCRSQFDEDRGAVSCEDLFDRAQTVDNPYCADIPVMQRVVAAVDQALVGRAGAYGELVKATRIFNRRWRRTPSWSFEIKPFDDLVKVGRHVAEHAHDVEPEPHEWRALARDAAAGHPRAQKRFREVLMNAVAI